MELNGKQAELMFTIKAVDSIPCDLRGQVVAFDAQGEMISDPLKTPWPMPWVTQEIAKYASGEYEIPAEGRFRVYNPEEPDQYVLVSLERIQAC